MSRISRREWLGATASALAYTPLASFADEDEKEVLPVAAVVTSYSRNTHADVIIGKILEGYRQDGGPGPNLKLVSLYTDQVPKNDLSRGLAEKHGFRIAQTIDEAVSLGTNKVQVAGVINVGEHGTYPSAEDTGQKKYPRRRLFDKVADAFERCGSVVPVFTDKHLAWNWNDAVHMFDRARELKIPLMAGSSLPVTWRHPTLSLPLGCEIEEAIAIGYGTESYAFHALESLQCMVERRRGGETGTASIESLSGDAILDSERKGRWSRKLADAALAVFPGEQKPDWLNRLGRSSAVHLIDYRDGMKASVAMLNGVTGQFGFAAKLKGRDEPVATWFKLEETAPFGHFEHLLRAIEHMIRTGKPAYPVERTLLTTGLLDCSMHSLAWDGAKIATPHLGISYEPTDWTFANRAN